MATNDDIYAPFGGKDIYSDPLKYGFGSALPPETASTYTPAQIADAINVSRQQGFSEADIATGLGRFLPNSAAVASALAANPKASPVIPTTPGAITPTTYTLANIATGLGRFLPNAAAMASALAANPKTYTPAQIADAINVSRQQGFSEADVATGLGRFLPNSAAVASALAANPKTYTPAQIADAINVSRQQGFSEADIATGLGRFLPNSAAVASALVANPNAARPPAPRQVTGTQLAPAAVTNTAITGTPYTNIYTPANMQQNAPTLAQISAASQSANPYQSLMALTPQRTLSPAYAGMLGQTTANTNQGGFNPAIYNPATAPVTGLLDTNVSGSGVGGGGGYDSGSANSAFDKLTNEEKAAYYSANPKMSSLTQGLQNAFGFTSLGMLQKGLVPDFVREQQAIAQGTEAYSGYRNFGKESTIPSGGMVSPGLFDPYAGDSAKDAGRANALAAAQAQAAQAQAAQAQAAQAQAAQAQAAQAQAAQAQAAAVQAAAVQAAADANATTGGGGGYGSGGGAGGSQPGGTGIGQGGYGPQYKGGLITPRDVKGPNPPGPDDGHASLDIGEYVIRKSAVKKYGSNIFEQINAGRIPAQRLKSLLE